MLVVTTLDVVRLPVNQSAIFAVLKEHACDVSWSITGLQAESLDEARLGEDLSWYAQFFLHFHLSFEQFRLVPIRVCHLHSFNADIIPIPEEIELFQVRPSGQIRQLDAGILKSRSAGPLFVRLCPQHLFREFARLLAVAAACGFLFGGVATSSIVTITD